MGGGCRPAEAGVRAHGDPYQHAHPDAHSNPNAYSDVHQYANHHAHFHVHPDGHANVHEYADSDSNPDADDYAHADKHPDANEYPHATSDASRSGHISGYNANPWTSASVSGRHQDAGTSAGVSDGDAITDFRDSKPGFPAPAVYSVNGQTGFVTIATGGGGVTSLNTLVGDLNLVAGTDITITPSGGDTLTIDATPAGSSLTVEEVDGSPSDPAITKIRFPNGTLGIAAHVATYTAATGFVSPNTTKGDVHGFSTVDARVPVGANGKILLADSAQTLGVGYSTRDIDAATHKITNVVNPTAASQEAATANYVDTADALKADKATTLTGTEGVTRTAGGDLGANAQMKLDIPGLTADATPDSAADYVVEYDASATAHKKVLIANLPFPLKTLGLTASEGVKRVAGTDLSAAAALKMDVNGLSNKATPVNTDLLPIWDVAGAVHKNITISQLPFAGGGNLTSRTADASPPGSPATGDLDFTTNSHRIRRWSGTQWDGYGPVYPLVDNFPAFTWRNQGTASVSTTNGGEEMIIPAVNGYAFRGREIAVPTAPYGIAVSFVAMLPPGFTTMGLYICDGTKLISFGFPFQAASPVFLGSEFTNVTTPAGVTLFNPGIFATTVGWGYAGPLYLRFRDDNTSWFYEISYDGGIRYYSIFSHARNTFLTPTKIGYGGYFNSAGALTAYGRLTTWTQT